ncbi:hypothetical protein BJY01DRAFT_202529 [Aspergillus pseudoustus]|uniref:F-box domain-containing protein n=1 Tax=Aspergillus pseudoustus TaxID=1810923 RepID=A0ABR4KYD4_9EURO
MIHDLPPELLEPLSLHLKDDTASLPRYARVCRQWQGVFERQLYRKVFVHSVCFKAEKGILSELQFRR